MLYETEGIVLSQTSLGEFDKVIAVLSRTEGIVRAVAKGVRKPTSRLSPVTQPFCEAIFQFYRGRTLDRVTQVSLKSSHPGIVGDYRKTVYASYLAELILELLPEREPQEEQYSLCVSALTCIEGRDDPWIVTKWGEIGLLTHAGLAPSFDHCAICGIPLGESQPGASSGAPPGEPSGDLSGLRFSASLGGVICPSCSGQATPGSDSLEVTPGTLRTLWILAAGVLEEFPRCPNITARGQVRDEIDVVLKKYVEYTLGKRLKSLSLVESIGVDAPK